MRVTPEQVDAMLHPQFDAKAAMLPRRKAASSPTA